MMHRESGFYFHILLGGWLNLIIAWCHGTSHYSPIGLVRQSTCSGTDDVHFDAVTELIVGLISGLLLITHRT
jgi:hypothetical protein